MLRNLPATSSQVKAVRSFNRFYTQRIGVLAPYLGSGFSLTDARVLYELAHRDQPTASEIGRDLGLDAGYLSRILRRFESKGWLAKAASLADARQSLLKLTKSGYEAFAPLQQKSRDEAAAQLAALPQEQRSQLIAAMATVQRLMEAPSRGPSMPTQTKTVVLRDHRPGDMGWVTQQHAEIYWKEYGWSGEFESLVAGICTQFIKNFDPSKERCWIAEVDGQRAGSVFLVRKTATVAQLRMLILTPGARGCGLGARLTDECLAFARAKGYKKMVLWTNSILIQARHLYTQRGFQLVKSEPFVGYGGHALVGEHWELKL